MAALLAHGRDTRGVKIPLRDADGFAMVDAKGIRLHYPATCRACGLALAAGESARWDPGSRVTACAACPPADPLAALPPPPLPGEPGRSAQREADRREANRRAKLRAGDPGSVIPLDSAIPSTTKAYLSGAEGERKVAGRLAGLAGSATIDVLHDRRGVGTRGNIDHLVIAPSGVFVVDSKRNPDRKVVRANGTLYVGGSKHSNWIDGMAWQVAQVATALDALAFPRAVPVRPVLCLVDTQPFSGPHVFGDVRVIAEHALVGLVVAAGPSHLGDRRAISHHLAGWFPEA